MVAFPNLEVLDVRDCEKLSYIFSPTMTHRITQLHELTTEESEMMSTSIVGENWLGEISVHEIEFPRLKGLTLSGLKNLVSFFPKVITTIATSTDDLKNPVQPLFNEKVMKETPTMTHRIPQLHELTTEESEMMSTSIAGENGLGEISVQEIEFPQLFGSTLSGLQNIVSFFPEEITTVATSTDDLKNPVQPLFNEKVAFPSLEYLELRGLQKARDIWCSELPTFSFSKLKRIQVEGCWSLGNMFCPSMARGLVNLQELIIKECWTMEAVVDKEEGREDAAQERRIDENLFPNLRELELKYLLKLRSFCQVTHPLELPLLGEVYIQMCPNMETFSLGHVITPKLQLVYLKYDWVLTDDLNATIRLYQEQQQEEEEEEEETLIIRSRRQRIDDDDDGDTDNDDATRH